MIVAVAVAVVLAAGVALGVVVCRIGSSNDYSRRHTTKCRGGDKYKRPDAGYYCDATAIFPTAVTFFTICLHCWRIP